MKKESSWKTIPGQKIRRQYFNIPIYASLVFVHMAVSTVTAMVALDPKITMATCLEDMDMILLLGTVVLLPLVLLSLLNRFFFGEVICILDEKGLHYDGGFIWWQDIKKAVYEPDVPHQFRRRIFCTNRLCLTVKPFAKEREIELNGAPFFLLRKIKKHRPDIPCKLSPWGITLILALSLGIPLLSFLGVLLA